MVGHGTEANDDFFAHVAAEIAQAERDAHAAAMNDAAQVCAERSQWAEGHIKENDEGGFGNYSNACDDCEELVRALAAKPGVDE